MKQPALTSFLLSTQTFLFCFSLFALFGFFNVSAQSAQPEVVEPPTTTLNPWGSNTADQSEVQVSSLDGIQRQQAVNATIVAAGTIAPPATTIFVPVPVTTTIAPPGNATTPKNAANATGINVWLLLAGLLFLTAGFGSRRLGVFY